MPDADFKIGQGDTGPYLQETLIGPDGTPLNLTGYMLLQFLMAKRDRSTPATISVATVVGDPTLGLVQHAFTTGETSTPGWFDYQWCVTLASGQIVTIPEDDGYRTMFIRKKIA
jgi:hypothetical protein